MTIYSLENTPNKNLEILAANPYPGRLLVMGYAGDMAVQAYAVEGRSTGSRNRILVKEDGVIGTETFDKMVHVKDPELTIYDAMRRVGSKHIVSNGDQTSTAVQYLRSGRTFEEAMESRAFEPDIPNYTPRISGFIDFEPVKGEAGFGISVIRKVSVSDLAVRSFWSDETPEIELAPGIGYCVHTYKGDGDPLPSFDEPPFSLPIIDNAQEMAYLLWDHLDAENRVAVAAKVINKDNTANTHIINAQP